MAAEASLRDRRSSLLAEPGLKGEDFCRRYAAEADAWLSGLADRAAGTASGTWPWSRWAATAAARCAPTATSMSCSSTTATATSEPSPTASGTRCGTRACTSTTPCAGPPRSSSAAADDVRVALGLLDGRLVWGEPKVAEPLLEKARAAWRDRLGTKYLPLLEVQMAERRATAGDVAFLLEPDLKESHGGLRDVIVLRAISAYAPLLADYADLASARRARPRCSPTSGSSSTAWPSVSTTSSCCRTRTRWRTRWASPTRTRSCSPSRRPAVRSPGSATTCGAGAGSGTRPHPRSVASAAAAPDARTTARAGPTSAPTWWRSTARSR